MRGLVYIVAIDMAGRFTMNKRTFSPSCSDHPLVFKKLVCLGNGVVIQVEVIG